VAAPFAVVHAGPRGEVELREAPAVTVLFNRAMRTLETPPDHGLPAIDVRSAAGEPVNGSWRWVGTHGALFTPDRPLPGATSFVAVVSKDARALDGSALGADYRFDFRTARPEVIDVQPIATDLLRPESSLRLTFNQAVDPAAVAHAGRLASVAPDGTSTTIPFATHRPPPDPITKRVPAEGVVVAPGSPLPRDRAITFTLPATFRGGEGPRAMETPYAYEARTYGPLRLVDLVCDRIADKGRCVAHRDVTVRLSNPVAPEELRAHLRTPGLPPMKVPAGTKPRLDARTDHLLGVDPDRGKRYQLTLTAGMRDVFGQTLAADTTVALETEAPFVLPPGVTPGPHSPPAAGPSPDPDNYAPRRAVLDYRVSVGMTGHVLEAEPRSGGHRLPIGTVNIPTYGLVESALDAAQVRSWLRTPTETFLTQQSLAPSWIVPGAGENVRSVRDVDLDALLAPTKGRGAALVLLDVPGSGVAAQELVSVTDLGISAHYSSYGSLVWVTHLSTGQPVAKAHVAVFVGPDEKATAETDDEGLATIPGGSFDPMDSTRGGDESIRRDASLVVSTGDDWTVERVTRASVDYRAASAFQDLAHRAQWAGLLFTERGVYRPGETMKLAGLLRELDPHGLHAIERDVRVEVVDGRGASVFDGRARLDRFGAFSLDVPLPKTAHLGDARVVASVRHAADTATFMRAFALAAYVPKEFEVHVDADRTSFIRGDEAIFSVDASYLFGAPMPHAAVHVAITRAAGSFVPPGAADFATTDDAFAEGTRATEADASALGDRDEVLDATGRLTHREKLDDPRQTRPETVTFEAEVADLTRQTVAERASVLVHPAEVYAGIRIADRLATTGAPLRPQIVVVDPAGARRVGTVAHVDLIARRWTSFVENHGGVPHRGWAMKDETVGGCSATSRAEPVTCDLRLPEAGYFIARVTVVDSRGHVVHASTGLYAVAPGNAPAPAITWPDNDGRSLSLETNKSTYAVGDVAHVLVKSPFTSGEALVTVERDGVLSRAVVPVSGPTPIVDVPIIDAMYPNAFVSVHLVRGRVQPQPERGPDLGAPDFRVGYAELKIDRDAHRLRVDIAPSKKEYRPGEAFEGDVVVRDREGRAVESELTFYAVDEGVLMLTGYATPDPLPPFTEQRKLAVFTAESREGLARIHPLKDGEHVPILGWEYASARADGTAKGDEGGDGGSNLRASFRSTAYFEAGRVTSREGKAHYAFTLPDNLTTFRLMAVAAGEDDRFGFGQTPIVTSRPLMARPALPRVLRVGDAFEASVVLSSKKLGPLDATVTLDPKGVVAQGPLTKTAHLPLGGSVEVRFPVRATSAGAASFEFHVQGGGASDRVLVTRTVDAPATIETTTVYGEARGKAEVALGDLSGVREDRGSLDVRVAPTALVGLGESLDRLVDYPYGCTEQLASRTLPLLTMDSLPDFGGRRDVHGIVNDAIAKILAHQRDDGGFGYWDDSPASEPWLTAYALFALEAARTRGYAVPNDERDEAVAYVKRVLEHAVVEDATDEEDADAGAPDRDENAERKLDFATAAFAADAIATAGSVTPGTLNRLYDARAAEPLFARALLLHAMAHRGLPRDELTSFAKEIAAEVRVSEDVAVAPGEARDAYASLLDSDARATALVLRALLAVDPAHPLAARLARGLLGMREAGAWRSTQENAWALLALADYRAAEGPAHDAAEVRVSLGDVDLLRARFDGADREGGASATMATLLSAGTRSLSFAASGSGHFFYSASLHSAAQALPAKPRDDGFFVQKLVRAVDPAALEDAAKWIPRTTASHARAGDLVLVDLLLESAEPRKQVVLDDPLPAGLEALDTSFETTSRAATDAAAADVRDESDERPGALSGIGAAFQTAAHHRDVHDDRVLTFFEDLPAGIYHLRYLARATAIGSFVVPPTRAECMYTPEVSGRTEATTFVVEAKP
jgi:uncharacterized protein YfaS (alpha-2-macroglobulin family)